MNPLVSIGIPIYKRLNFLPDILRVVGSQDYPHIELIVSDNGGNGTKVHQVVDRYYSRPYRFRQNPSTVSISQHYNQLVNSASGKYFVLLCDDDEISANFISELVALLERFPSATAAIARQEMMDESGAIIRKSKVELPDIISGTDCIRAIWHTHEYGFECFATIMARTDYIKACGGYPDFRTGSHNDNALLIKLCLNRYIAFSSNCSFRWRVYHTSHGWSISSWDLAADSRQFLRFLDSDPRILEFSSVHPSEWKDLKSILVRMAWQTYFGRWRGIYRERLNPLEWVATAFVMPPIPAYYKQIARTLLGISKMAFGTWVKRLFL